jgi:hypothetical protein
MNIINFITEIVNNIMVNDKIVNSNNPRSHSFPNEWEADNNTIKI